MAKEDFHKKDAGMLVGNFELKIYNYLIFLRATLKETFTAKYNGTP